MASLAGRGRHLSRSMGVGLGHPPSVLTGVQAMAGPPLAASALHAGFLWPATWAGQPWVSTLPFLPMPGASVISTRCSETYETKTALLSLFGIPLWYHSQSPRVILQVDTRWGRQRGSEHIRDSPAGLARAGLRP